MLAELGVATSSLLPARRGRLAPPQAWEVMAMGLSAQDREALDLIEDGLAGSDPRLASMLATFSRLTAEEAMPARERIGRARWRATRWLQRWRYKALALWLLLMLALIGAALAAMHAGGAVCPTRRQACSAQWPVTHPKSGRASAAVVIHLPGLSSAQTAGATRSDLPAALRTPVGEIL